MLIAASQSDSLTFWTAAGTVVGFGILIVALVTAWIIYTTRTRRRSLLYSMSPPVLLLSAAPAEARPRLEVRYEGDVIQRPVIVRLRLRIRGRHDISTDAFDQAKPIIFDIGGRIVAMLQTESAAVPPMQIEGSRILVGPGLIRSEQSIVIAVLADAERVTLTCQHHLIDVKVRREPYEYPIEETSAALAIGLGFRQRIPD